MLSALWNVYIAVFVIQMLIGLYFFYILLKRLLAKRTRCIHGSRLRRPLGDMHMMQVVVVLLLGLIPAFGYAYEMVIKHDPWWAYEMNGNSIESSYQFFHPYYKEKPKKTSFGWNSPTTSTILHKMPNMDFRKVPKVDFSKIPMPKMPSIPSYPNKPRKMSEERRRAMNAREWPDWIPPIRMVKLPLDDPPAF